MKRINTISKIRPVIATAAVLFFATLSTQVHARATGCINSINPDAGPGQTALLKALNPYDGGDMTDGTWKSSDGAIKLKFIQNEAQASGKNDGPAQTPPMVVKIVALPAAQLPAIAKAAKISVSDLTDDIGKGLVTFHVKSLCPAGGKNFTLNLAGVGGTDGMSGSLSLTGSGSGLKVKGNIGKAAINDTFSNQ